MHNQHEAMTTLRAPPSYGKAEVHLKVKTEVSEQDVTSDKSWQKHHGSSAEPCILFVNSKLGQGNDEDWVSTYRDFQTREYLRRLYGMKVIALKEGQLDRPEESGSPHRAVILCIRGHGGESGTLGKKNAPEWFKSLSGVLNHHRATLRVLYVFGCHGAALATGWNRIKQQETSQPGLQELLHQNNYDISVRGMWQNMTVTVQGEPVGKSDRDSQKMLEYSKVPNTWCKSVLLSFVRPYGENKQKERLLEKDYVRVQEEREKFFMYAYPFVPPEQLTPSPFAGVPRRLHDVSFSFT